MYRFYTVCMSFILFACPGFCTLSASRDDAAGPGDLLRFFAASFVRSYPGDWPAFSRAGNFGFSARFYRRSGPALFYGLNGPRADALLRGVQPAECAIKGRSIRVAGSGCVGLRSRVVESVFEVLLRGRFSG
jgi:hypothetical protein